MKEKVEKENQCGAEKGRTEEAIEGFWKGSRKGGRGRERWGVMAERRLGS